MHSAVHYRALPCIDVHSPVVAVQYRGITVHVPLPVVRIKLKIPEFELDLKWSRLALQI